MLLNAAPENPRRIADELGRWRVGVELGALGRAAAARTALADLICRPTVDSAIVSLAHSTVGSLTRQAGDHVGARAHDGTAARIAAASRAGGRDDDLTFAAWLDAIVGLAADSLGVGDFGASLRLLDRAGADLSARPDGDDWTTVARTRLRHAWVSTETGLFAGDLACAVDARATLDALAAAAPSERHRIKSRLIGAAVDAASGDLDAAAAAAGECASDCASLGLLPLEWAAQTMLAGLPPAPVEAAERVEQLRARLESFGMPVSPVA